MLNRQKQWLFWIALCLLLMSLNSVAQSLAGAEQQHAPQISLVTFGPGPQIWARFGHNAIRVKWPATNARPSSDSLYNFGYFDFNEPGFYWNYVTGNMQYYAVAENPDAAFFYYQQLNRSIREQTLSLTDAEAFSIATELERLTQPDLRRYRYDYFFNNCSTRVRDVLNQALSSTLDAQFTPNAVEHTLRWQALRMVQDDLWLYLGLHIGLGRIVDQPISQWENTFLPTILANQLQSLENNPVNTDSQLFQGRSEAQDFQARYLSMSLIALISIAVIWLPTLFKRRWLQLLGVRCWLLLSGLAGLLLLFLWLMTAHEAAWQNENLLLLLPSNLLILGMRNRTLERMAVNIIPIGISAALLMKLLPHTQFNTDLLVWLIPTQLATWYCWVRYRL